MWNLCGRPRDGLINKVRLESKCKYKLAMKEEALFHNMDYDDELSILYLMKDTDKFWTDWNFLNDTR